MSDKNPRAAETVNAADAVFSHHDWRCGRLDRCSDSGALSAGGGLYSFGAQTGTRIDRLELTSASGRAIFPALAADPWTVPPRGACGNEQRSARRGGRGRILEYLPDGSGEPAGIGFISRRARRRSLDPSGDRSACNSVSVRKRVQFFAENYNDSFLASPGAATPWILGLIEQAKEGWE